MHLPDHAPDPGQPGRAPALAVAHVRRAHAAVLVCQVWLPGCGPGDSDLASAASTSVTETAAGETTAVVTDGTSSPTTSGAGSEATAGSEVESDTAAVTCGNGQLEADEACDDGDLVNGDGCNEDCTVSAALVWEYRSGLKGDDSFRGVASTADAKIFAVGARFTDEGTQDRWVTQFQDQALAWAETYHHGEFEAALAVAVHGSAIYVAGAVSPGGSKDAWIGKLALDGAIVWEDALDSGFGDDFVTNLAVTPEGDVVVAGVISLEGGLAATWTRRYGTSGEVQWTHEIPILAEALYTVGPGVAVTAEHVVVGGYRLPKPGEYQAMLSAYPPGGGEPSFMIDLPTIGGVFGVASDPRGALALVLQDLTDGFVVDRTSSTGELLWSSTACAGDLGSAVAIDGQGDIVVVGAGPGAIGRNIRLCKFSAEGDLRWGKDLDGGLGEDRGLAVAILPDDRIVATGSMWGGATERTDAWLAVFTP